MIFVEGKGDVKSVPVLAQRVVEEIEAWDVLTVDHEPFRVNGVAALVKDGCAKWHRWLSAAGRTRTNTVAVLLVLDGDIDKVPQQWATYSQRFNTTEFCAFRTATLLGEEAAVARAGEAFSLASVFALSEFETWLLAGAESLRGIELSERRGKVPDDAACPCHDIESVRDAKGRLQKIIPEYSQSLDQCVLTRKVDLALVRDRCRSFGRFCSAIKQLADARRGGRHIVTPGLGTHVVRDAGL